MTTTIMTIRRPNGDVEKVERHGEIAIPLRYKMVEATKAAGKGDILSFDTVSRIPRALPSLRHCCSHWTRDQGCPLHGDAE